MTPFMKPNAKVKPNRQLTQLAQLNDLVERTSAAMWSRLQAKHHEGRRGWKTEITDLLTRFDSACARRDFLDAAILAAMLYDFQQRNAQRQEDV